MDHYIFTNWMGYPNKKTKLHNKYYVNYYVSIIYQNLNPMYLLKS
ncbi:hypothetical protein C1A50_2738 [Paenibacillus polymyxa]|nr:hypothetical protein C1A50_2738 [Paenibacillus polymyxa]